LKANELRKQPATYIYRIAMTRDLYLPVFGPPATYIYRFLSRRSVDK
jgi:hypothetical protein